jgi:nucleotide-binding universal stress UspA family protein
MGTTPQCPPSDYPLRGGRAAEGGWARLRSGHMTVRIDTGSAGRQRGAMAWFALEPADRFDGMVDYLIDTPEGFVGVLDGWERNEHGQPSAVNVAQGWFGRRRFSVPIGQISGIDHGRGSLTLATGAAPPERPGWFPRLVGRLYRPYGDQRSEEASVGWGRGGPVICGVSDDHRADTVVAVAAGLAERTATGLTLVHVTPADVPPGVSAAPGGAERLRDEEASTADQLLHALLWNVRAPVAISLITARGDPAHTLDAIAVSEDASFIVIGSGGKGSVSAALIGSVSRHLANHAHCPVVVVPPTLDEPRQPRQLRDSPSSTRSVAPPAANSERPD